MRIKSIFLCAFVLLVFFLWLWVDYTKASEGSISGTGGISASTKVITYNRNGTMDYVKIWCGKPDPNNPGKYIKKYNSDCYRCFDPEFSDCDKSGTDCAVFISQALVEGGFDFECVSKTADIGKGCKTNGDSGKDLKGIRTPTFFGVNLESTFCFNKIATINLYDLKAGNSGDTILNY